MNINFDFTEEQTKTLNDAFNILFEFDRLVGLTVTNRIDSDADNEDHRLCWEQFHNSLCTVRAFYTMKGGKFV